MNPKLNVSGEQLEDAFALFNQMSEKLSDSYGDIETQIAQLTKELARAHDERLKQLAEKEHLAKRLKGLFDTLPAGIIVLDGNGRINQNNPIAEDMLGSDLSGKLWELVAKRSFISGADELRLQDGRWVSVTATPLEADPGKIILVTDISETYNLQNMLNRQQRLTSLGEMLASLAHQVRTPLASALLYLSNINHVNAKPEDRIRFTEKARERLYQLERMVSDMLIFARGGVTASECFELTTFVTQLKQTLEPLIVQANANMNIHNHVDHAELDGNSDAISAVLQNLVGNALEACNNKPEIKITIVLCSDDMLEFLVEDNGNGIDEQIKERILEPFFTTKSSGTGLGLAVVNEIVSSHNGSIEITSKQGVGSSFSIKLPLATSRDILPSNITEHALNVTPAYEKGTFKS